jgi:hypothetical protein
MHAKRTMIRLIYLDGIETGIRQLIRKEPLETRQIESYGELITLPTLPEMLRIKAVLILTRFSVFKKNILILQ